MFITFLTCLPDECPGSTLTLSTINTRVNCFPAENKTAVCTLSGCKGRPSGARQKIHQIESINHFEMHVFVRETSRREGEATAVIHVIISISRYYQRRAEQSHAGKKEYQEIVLWWVLFEEHLLSYTQFLWKPFFFHYIGRDQRQYNLLMGILHHCQSGNCSIIYSIIFKCSDDDT